MTQRYYFDPRVAAAYDAEHAGQDITTDDIPFYVDIARTAAVSGLPVLELGCGTGRVSLPMADAGARVTGLDNSPAMLDVARQRAPDGNPRWLIGDMTSFELGEVFGAIVIPFRSFSLLTTDTAQASCLSAVLRHLAPGGVLALNVFNGEPMRAAAAGEAPLTSRHTRGLAMRYQTVEELEGLLEQAGLTVTERYGWFDRSPLETGSREIILIAKARSALPALNPSP